MNDATTRLRCPELHIAATRVMPMLGLIAIIIAIVVGVYDSPLPGSMSAAVLITLIIDGLVNRTWTTNSCSLLIIWAAIATYLVVAFICGA